VSIAGYPYDYWKLATPEYVEEPEREGCECVDDEHGSDCPLFEPPTAESLRREVRGNDD
jgi:hypothetical protein